MEYIEPIITNAVRKTNSPKLKNCVMIYARAMNASAQIVLISLRFDHLLVLIYSSPLY